MIRPGKLLRACTEQVALELGLPGPVMAQDFAAFGTLATPCWIVDTWKFLSTHDMHIEDQTPCLPLRRIGDEYLTQAFYDAGFRDGHLRRLNLCRLYLRVTTLADITTADGRQVTSAAWDGRRDPIRQPKLDWPIQGNLTAVDWTQWQTALSTAFSLRGRSLSRPLGAWTDDAEDIAWPWFYDPGAERLYHRDEHNHWSYLTKAPIRTGRSAQAKFHNRFLTDTPPANRHRATVEQHGSYTCLTGFTQEENTPAVMQTQKSLLELIQELDPDARWAVKNFIDTDNGETIAAALQDGSAIAVSDGSYKEGRAAASWVLEGRDSVGRIEGPCLVPGTATDKDSYRAELSGIYAVAVIVALICELHDIEQGSPIILVEKDLEKLANSRFASV